MRSRTRHGVRTILVALGIAATAQAAHAVAYDTPSLSVTSVGGQTGLFDVLIQVQAGPSGTPAGFTLEWMTRADYVRLGGWPAYSTDVKYCSFLDQPSLNIRSGTSTFRLGPGESAIVEPGDLFDETGIATNWTDVLAPSTEYVVRAYAEGDLNGDPSPYSADLSITTTQAECTVGFWKNHPETWPASATPMLLGTVSYTASQLLSILGQPAQGNGLISLAYQLISVKLNLANGSDPTNIAATIASADLLIGGLVIPPIGSGSLPPSQTNPLTQTLDDYNNGRIPGVNNCPTPTRAITWGRVKTLYR